MGGGWATATAGTAGAAVGCFRTLPAEGARAVAGRATGWLSGGAAGSSPPKDGKRLSEIHEQPPTAKAAAKITARFVIRVMGKPPLIPSTKVYTPREPAFAFSIL
jgi:hypothetical protein